jgi:hypothetical protein
VLREPIATLDDEARRLVWPAVGGRAPLERRARSSIPGETTSVLWTADFLPDELRDYFSRAIEAGMAAMQRSLGALAV